MSMYFRASKPVRRPYNPGRPLVPLALQVQSQNVPEPTIPDTYTGIFAYSSSPPPCPPPTSPPHFPHFPTQATSLSLPPVLVGTLQAISLFPPTLLIQPQHPTQTSHLLPVSAQIPYDLLPLFLLYTSYSQQTVTFRLDPHSTSPGLPTVMDVMGVGSAWEDAIAASAYLDTEMNPPTRRARRRNRATEVVASGEDWEGDRGQSRDDYVAAAAVAFDALAGRGVVGLRTPSTEEMMQEVALAEDGLNEVSEGTRLEEGKAAFGASGCSDQQGGGGREVNDQVEGSLVV